MALALGQENTAKAFKLMASVKKSKFSVSYLPLVKLSITTKEEIPSSDNAISLVTECLLYDALPTAGNYAFPFPRASTQSSAHRVNTAQQPHILSLAPATVKVVPCQKCHETPGIVSITRHDFAE